MKKWVLGALLGFLFSSYCSHKEESNKGQSKMCIKKPGELKSSPEILRKELNWKVSQQFRKEENFAASDEELQKWRTQEK